MYIYFDTNGTIKEIVNDKSIRNGSNEANKIYCYLEGEPEIDDIWYLQKLPSGELSNEVSFKNSTITKAIPYDAKRDMKYFKDFEQYTFYVFTLNTFLTSQKGLNIATIRVSVDNTIWALGELTFNVQENVINVDNGITQSQYDYLLLAYASRTLNEQAGRDLNDLIDDKIEAKIGDLASGSPKVFDTEYIIEHMHNDEGIAVATDTGDIWVWNDTQQEYQNTGMKYLNNASNIVYHDGNQLKDGSDNDFYPNIADGCVTQEKLDNDLFDDLLLKETTDITSSFTLQNRYLDKANGNANPDSNSRCTDFIDLSLYTEFLISGYSQYATCMICTYDENQQFLRYYCDGGSAGVTYTDYDFIPQSDEKYAKFGTYQYTTHPLIIKSVEVIGKAENKTPNYLYKKKYVACGDSFTKGDVIASNKVYPYLIAERNNMTLVNMSANGSYAHNGADGFTNSSNSYYYQNIPLDADYITIAYGLNETSTTIGTKDSADNTTIWGAYNEILTWIITNIPNAKVGIISNDAWMTYELRNALQEIASYYGVSFLDLKEYGKPMMISGKYTEDGDVNSTIKNLRTNQYCVSNLNGHPNELGHRMRSYIIENFLRGMDATDNRYTKTETDTLLNTKANKTNTYTKSEVDTALNDKVNTSDFDVLDGRVDDIEDDIDTLKSVQNVVDIVATYSALQSYDTSDLGTNDKIQVIADETHSGASTIYNWNGSAWQYVGAYGTNSYTKTETLEQIDLHKVVNKTYSELATLKSGNNLVAGQLYRITDYVTKTNGVCNGVANDVRSMEHPFDIVLRAISNNKFSENARVLLHSGDTYFANSNLNSWQLWYSFDNDSVRFEWADTLTGKGVIYRMIDEFGNDLPYDFKNIQFKRYKITATTDTRHSNAIGKYLGFSGNYNCTSDNTDYVWYFTFSKRADGTDLSLTETTAPSYTNCYYVKEVKIGEYLSDTPNYRGIQALNNIVFECDNIVVDVQMGVCSNHNTFIGNKDITYVYFKEMCRNNIVYGEMSHARADECFEQNIMGDFVALSQYTLCWNKFSHHFARNIAVQMQSNDFEAQVSDCKFPENFTRNHIFNMWDSVDASTHDTFNRCELGLFSYTTLSGGGTWDGVYGISLDHCTIKIANLFGSKLGRMEYVSISEGVNNFNVLNLTVGALFGSSSKVLTIALADLNSYNIQSVYEKKIDFANETVNNLRMLIYTWASFSVSRNIIDYGGAKGTISSVDGTVTWSAMNTLGDKLDDIETALNTKMLKLNPTGTGSISMNDGNASGTNSYANGSGATASGNFSRAIGFGATASGSYSTAIIGNASGSGAIAIGNMANASGDTSKALGEGAKAKGDNQTVIGNFNIPDTSSLEIVGNGAYMNTSNARLLDANGNEYLKGDIYVNSTFTKDANGDLDTKSGTKLVAVSANPTLAGTEADLTGLEVDGTKYKVSSGGGSGTTVVANPTLQGGEADLTSITIGNTNYAIPSGGGGSLYKHSISLDGYNTNFDFFGLTTRFDIILSTNTPLTFEDVIAWLYNNGYNNDSNLLPVLSKTSIAPATNVDKHIVIGLYSDSVFIHTILQYVEGTNIGKLANTFYNTGKTCTDTVTQIF